MGSLHSKKAKAKKQQMSKQSEEDAKLIEKLKNKQAKDDKEVEKCGQVIKDCKKKMDLKKEEKTVKFVNKDYKTTDNTNDILLLNTVLLSSAVESGAKCYKQEHQDHVPETHTTHNTHNTHNHYNTHSVQDHGHSNSHSHSHSSHSHSDSYGGGGGGGGDGGGGGGGGGGCD